MKYAQLLTVVSAALMLHCDILAAPRPNILYFYVDDLGWGGIGPNCQAKRKAEGKPYVRTPNLDSLAAGGINFARAYGCTVCSPARSSQQTGYHQGHTFADRNDPNNAKKAMRTGDICMGEALAAAGYVTGYWGKWGYGGSADRKNPKIDNIQTLPTSHGYRHVLAELHHVRAHTFFQPTLWSAPAAAGAVGGLELIPNSMKKYAGNTACPDYPSMHNHPEYPATAYCDDCYAFAAMDFVRKHAINYNETKQPFFALLACQIPHAPFNEIQKLPEWDRAYKDDPHFSKLAAQSRQWAAMVTRIDAHFGNILAALEDPDGDGNTSDSVADNTLVVFQSDNGGPGGSSCKEYDSNGGLRGTKGSIYEGGIRIPTIIRWPNMITADTKLKAGTTTNMLLDASDLLPTFCELAGVKPPVGVDGVSLAPTLTRSGHQRQRDFLIHEAGKNASIIRGKYKLIINRGGRKKKGRKKGKKAAAPGIALYDLQADRAESNNIAGDNAELVEELKAILLAERVTEPKGFANTYHRWTGSDRAAIASADNWSDYVYQNDGRTYMTDDGAPRVSWTAIMENKTNTPAAAIAKSRVPFLGLEIRGTAAQELVVAESGRVTGRNEIRVAENGTLTLAGGTASSLRWIDILAGGTVRGAGSIDCSLYNVGAVDITGTLAIGGDYIQQADGTLAVTLGEKNNARAAVSGEAAIAGTLVVKLSEDYKPPSGEQATILTAKTIQGSFSVVDERFTVSYSNTAVTLTAR